MVFSCSMRGSRIADRAQQLVQAMLFNKATVRPIGHAERSSAGFPTPVTATLGQQAHQAFTDVAVNLVELVRRVARTEVTTPSTQNGIQNPNHLSDVLHPRPAPPFGEIVDLGADRLHRALRWPAEQVASALEVRTHDPQVAAQELQAVLAKP